MLFQVLQELFLSESKLPFKFGTFAVKHAINGRSFVPHRATGTSPYEALFGASSPAIKHARAIAYRVLYLQTPNKRQKETNFRL